MRKIKRIAKPDAAMAIGAHLMGKEILGRGVMQVDVVHIGEHEHDLPQRTAIRRRLTQTEREA